MLLTIDVEEITDTNFNILWKKEVKVDYEKLIDNFIELSQNHQAKAFVLGTFAKKYPELVKKLYSNGIEIASHGYKHNLVYEVEFEKWSEDIRLSKKILEDLIGCEVKGYRSPSWSLPFQKNYYEELVKQGFNYSSSYFPIKTYMYGNSINKKTPFIITTKYGKIMEYPIARSFIPFSGGFYLRVLPLWILKIFFKKTENSILYIHPYELMDKNLMKYFSKYTNFNLDFLLAFYSLGLPKNKIKEIISD
jgi:polysaccharide deacetylase family protein (PEP-CTERM system associated)